MRLLGTPLILLLVWSGGVLAADGAFDGPPGGHVRGIGGVFFKADDPVALGAWYRRHFGIDVGESGFAHFLWREHADPAAERRTVWSPFPRSSDYFGAGDQQLMINYIVVDLDGFLQQLEASGISRVGEIAAYDYGRFAWVVDLEGNRVELWEPSPPAAD